MPKLPEEFLDYCNDVQVAFHGVNKSGSLAMANVMKEAFDSAGRGSELLSHYHLGGDFQKYIAEVNSGKASRGLLISHYLYGALPPRPGRVWITQFRHPLPRILSCYQWLKNKYERKNGVDTYQTLEQFIADTKGISHSQIGQLSMSWGVRRKVLTKSLSAEDMLNLSLDALERNFSLIGIAEHFEESIFMFGSMCRLVSVTPWKRDVRNPGRINSELISKEQREQINYVFRNDFLLYESALARFKLQSNYFDFGTDLLEYKAACLDQYNDRLIV